MSSRKLVHGTRASYINLRCRCPECREANRKYIAAWKERRRERAQERGDS